MLIMRLAVRIAASAAAVIAAGAALPSAARAEGVLGVSIGRSEDVQGASGEANHTLGVLGRMSLGGRLSGQLELQQTEAPGDGSRLRSATALLVIDLVQGSRLVPMLVGGAGLDRASFLGGGVTMEGHHFEGGLGLEYRTDGGFFVGADLRLGGRSIENDQVVLDGAGGIPPPPPPGSFPPPIDPKPLVVTGIAEGEYRTLRLTIGARF